MRAEKRIRTVLYGDQRLSAAELEVIHTPAMQRLYGLKQLGWTDRVYIDASHSRLHHVVGVLEQAEKLVGAIAKNLKRKKERLLRYGTKGNATNIESGKLAEFVEERRDVIRFIGLLHDLTHAPFGHTIEDEINLVDSKHDEPVRQADSFSRLVCQLITWLSIEAFGPEWGASHPTFRPFRSQYAGDNFPPVSEAAETIKRLVSDGAYLTSELYLRLEQREIASMFAQLNCAMTALLYLEAVHKASLDESDLPDASGYWFQAAINAGLRGTQHERLLKEFDFNPHRDAFMLDIIGNTVCADLLDYAQRDSHYAGLRLDCDPGRIAENFTVVPVDAFAYEVNHPEESVKKGGRDGQKKVASPFEGWCLRTAISLMSHKYRTDVPSELMNLLNVRFYLYERVIFHPTKCAAGAMLGTALQLIGWRRIGNNSRQELPKHLRFVGDEVLMHDISAALNFLIDELKSKGEENPRITRSWFESLSDTDKVHNGIIREILKPRLEPEASTDQTLAELEAARMLLDRLTSRRFFRPVFRALPSSKDQYLQAGADALADYFRDPENRFNAERKIEEDPSLELPLGTITIHCPVRNTARKVANVFLTKPGEDGDGTSDPVYKLKDIESLDKEIFGEHQKAVKAVEKMYGSMWRLHVYTAPEQLGKWDKIAKVAGKVIFEAIDQHEHFEGIVTKPWRNDPSLEDELKEKTSRLFRREMDLDSPTTRRWSERLPSRNKSLPRFDQVITVIRAYVKIGKRNVDSFQERRQPRIDRISNEEFERLYATVGEAVVNSMELDEGPVDHKGCTFREFCELVDDVLNSFAGSRQSLFEEPEE